MSVTSQAVFLSYASQDAEAARRICDALRAAGVEVWFDQSELVGGDVWDAKIRKQIAECALFVPVISANTQARLEGYFRIEWKLAAQRTYAMADEKAFLLPVVIDDTRDAEARVPAEFKAVQWTRLTGAEAGKFAVRIQRLLAGGGMAAPAASPQGNAPVAPALPPARRRRWLLPALAAAVLAAVAGVTWAVRRQPVAAATPPAPAALSPSQEALARIWELLDRPEMGRAELELADGIARKATAADETNADLWAAWSSVSTWTYFHGYERVPDRLEAARNAAAKAMHLAPRAYEARLAQALFWVRIDPAPQRLGEARRLLRELLQERPDEPRALYALGFSLANDPETFEESIAILQRLARNPGFTAVALDEVGWLNYFAGRFAQAQEAADRSVAARPYWNNLGLQIILALYTHGDTDRAQRFLAQMPASVMQEDWGIAFASRTYLWSRQPQRAIEALESVQREWVRSFFDIVPRAYLQAVARRAAGQAVAAQRDFQRALDQFNQALAQDPNNGSYLLGKAVTLRELGQEAAAQEAYHLLREMQGSLRTETALVMARVQFEPPATAVALVRTMVEAPYTLDITNTFRVEFTANSLRLNPWFDRLRSEPEFANVVAAAAAREASGASAVAGAAAEPAEKSVAVLAFADLSEKRDSEYFSDGISEELLNVLAKVPGLKVTARTSAFFFKGKEVPVPEIARQLGVAYVVEGSVRKAGDKVRITAQLIKAADGFQVWSDTFTRDLQDIFAVQDEIAGTVARNLSLQLGVGSGAKARVVAPEAYRLYLEARQAWNLRTPEGLQLAENLLNRAIAIEPRFAPAHAALVDVWMVAHGDGAFAGRDSPPAVQAIAKAEAAVALDPDCAEAQAALGNALGMAWRPAESFRALRRAVELNPNYATAHQWLGRRLSEAGDLPGARAALRRAAELDPLSHRILDNASDMELLAGDFDAAMALLRRAEKLNPGSLQVRCKRAFLLWTMGRNDEATAAARALAAEPDDERHEYRDCIAGIVLAGTGHPDEAERVLARMNREGDDYASALAYLGRVPEFLAKLDNLTVSGLHWYLLDPRLEAVRAAPEFAAWMTRVGRSDALARAKAWNAMHAPGKFPATK